MQNDARQTNEWRGYYSSIREPQTHVIRDADTWAALRERHFPAGKKIDHPLLAWPSETIDFSKSTVVAIYAGDEPSGGFQIAINDIRTEADAVHVNYKVTPPPADETTITVMTQPYVLKAIPRTDLPVVFHRQ